MSRHAPILAFLFLATAAAPAAEPILVVRGEGIEMPRKFSAEDLAAMPRASARASIHGGPEAEYSGVPLGEILVRAGVPSGEALRGENVRLYALVEAADSYSAVFALPELDPAFTDDAVILADRRDGRPLDPAEGPLRLVVPGDKRQSRWVREVVCITIGRAKVLPPYREEGR